MSQVTQILELQLKYAGQIRDAYNKYVLFSFYMDCQALENIPTCVPQKVKTQQFPSYTGLQLRVLFLRQGGASIYVLHDTFDKHIGDMKKPVTMSSLISTIRKLLHVYLRRSKHSSSLPTQYCNLGSDFLRQVGDSNYVLYDTFGVLIDCIKSLESRSSLRSTIRKFKFSS